MICIHLIQGAPVPPICQGQWQAIDVADGYMLLVHGDCHYCKQPSTRLPHLLSGAAVGATVASALAAYDVQVQDSILTAVMKVAAQWPAVYP